MKILFFVFLLAVTIWDMRRYKAENAKLRDYAAYLSLAAAAALAAALAFFTDFRILSFFSL